jgi:hypothetical protein
MADEEYEISPFMPEVTEQEARQRRDFLISMGKWSKAVIGGVVLGSVLLPGKEAEAIGWSNHGNWVNLGGGGPGRGWRRGWPGWGYGWYNGRPGWYNRPRWGWHNHRPGWYNQPNWINGSWINR